MKIKVLKEHVIRSKDGKTTTVVLEAKVEKNDFREISIFKDGVVL